MAETQGSIDGELEAFPLLELVPFLADKRASGTLEIEKGDVRRRFTLVDGFLTTCASSVPREHLGQFLVDVGMLSSEAAARAYQDQEKTRQLLGKLLADSGALDAEQIKEALRLKIREGLLDGYRWGSGFVRYNPELKLVPNGLAVAVRLNDLHREALQREKEWTEIALFFPATDVGIRPVLGSPWKGALQPEEEVIVELAREGKTVLDALNAFRDGEYRTYRRLVALVKKELIRPDRSVMGAPRPQPTARALLENAKSYLKRGLAADAASTAIKAVERGASRAAMDVLEQANNQLALLLADELLNMDGAPVVKPPPRELARMELLPAERYLLTRLVEAKNVRGAIAHAPMGELEALRMLRHLVDSGVLAFEAGEPPARDGARP